MKRMFATTFALATFVALLSSALDAGKPQPPPPPPPPGPEVYQWRPDLGGMLDTSRNLIWGYEAYALSGGTAPYDFLKGQDYPTMMQSKAADFYDEADYYSGIGDMDTAALYFEAAGSCEDAASFTNWRFPTKEEASDAVAKKLFHYDVQGFSGYWSTPLGPGMAYDGYTACWTSTAGKTARGGFPTYWTYTPATGGTGEAPKGYNLDVIWVRSYMP